MKHVWFFVKHGYISKVVLDGFDDQFVDVGGVKHWRKTTSTLYTPSVEEALHTARQYQHRRVRDLLNQVEDIRQELKELEEKWTAQSA